MSKTYTAVAKHEGGWWFGWIEEVQGVNCQERTRSELIETLQVALREALAAAGEDFEAFEIVLAGPRKTPLETGDLQAPFAPKGITAFPPTTIEQVFGCAYYAGPAKTLEEMEEAIGARFEHPQMA